MVPSTPFIDRDTETLDYNQILLEAIPLARLIGLFVALALIPLLFTTLSIGHSLFGALFALVAQVILAIGAGITLLYIIVRANQLAEEY